MFHKSRTTLTINTNRLSPHTIKFIGGFFLLTGIPLNCHGMDIAYSFFSAVAAPVASLGANYIPENVKSTVSGFANNIYGEPKDFDNLFNEFTANRMETELKDLVENYKKCYESKATNISSHKRHDGIYNFNINEVSQSAEIARTYLLKYSLAILTLDYTHQCKTLIEQSTKDVEEIKSKYEEWEILGDPSENQKKENAQLIINYLNKIKLNLGSALYAKYKYTRKGGWVDRGMTSFNVGRKRFKYWGVSELPDMDLTSPNDEINNILKGKGQIAICIGPAIEVYNTTLEFLKEPEANIIKCNDPYSLLNAYKSQFRELFKQEPSEEKLFSPLVTEYNLVRDDINKQMSAGLISPMIPTPSVPIPRQNSSKLKKPNSQSLGDTSSLPINFRAAMDAHNDKARDMKIQSPLPTPPSRTDLVKTENPQRSPIAPPQNKGFANIVESYEQAKTLENSEHDHSKSSDYSEEASDSYTSSEDSHSEDNIPKISSEY